MDTEASPSVTPRSTPKSSQYNLEFKSPQSSSKKKQSTESGPHNDSSQTFIVSLIDNRAKDIGIAAINLKSSDIYLTQFSENSATYSNTYNMIQLYNPDEVLLPNSLSETKLSDMIQSKFANKKITNIARKFYNEVKGSVLIKELAVSDHTIESEVASKYLSISAASALLQYTEHIQKMVFAKQSLKFHYKPLSGHLQLDPSSISNLELIYNLKDGSKKNTLLSIINHTQTPMGSKLLQSTLIQPLTDINTITTRLDCVEELLREENNFFNISKELGNFVFDIDHLLSQFTHCNQSSTRSSHGFVQHFICLKRVLQQSPQLAILCDAYENPMFKAVSSNLKSDSLTILLDQIEQVIEEDVSYTRNTLGMQIQKCFAVKTGINGLLDVARRQLMELTQEVHEHVRQLIDQTGITSLKLQYNTRRGYYLSYDNRANISPQSDATFIQQLRNKKRVVCSTEDLNSKNFRIKDLVEEILLLTESVISDLIGKVRSLLSSLYKVSESIAMLDMLISFASVVTLNSDYVRPSFTLDGPIAIKQGRHPIMEKCKLNSYIANDVYISESSNLHIITGPNMSGKSVFLRQVACITILAHCGCFVPATFASLRIVDRIFTRISTDDSMESNASTFLVEMKDVAHIVQNVTNKSLVLIDELGRGTSNVEGSSIAWSICEYLMSLKAYTMFVTHYMQLSELELLYPNIKNFHLMVTTTGDGRLSYLYSIGEGSCNQDGYGIKLAKMLGLPKVIVTEADEICRVVLEEKKKKSLLMHQDDATRELKNVYQFAQRILALRYSTLSGASLKNYVEGMKQQLPDKNEIEDRVEEEVFVGDDELLHDDD
ncbi:DNA mismatch repair protein MutS [Acrasis kona]|uniref:DNA mismatch repair protein MutS n=1 Tax=Acrasis kona TaxID=1008807 RepID=A0AAW2Z8N0_9EUKA